MKQRTGLILVVIVAALIAGALGGAWLVHQGVLFSTPAPVAATTPSMPMPAAPPVTPSAPAEIIITIPADSIERMHLGFAQVTEDAVSTEVRVPGTVQPNGYREVRVTSLVGGIATQVSAALGQTVKRGQTLVQLFSRELAEAQTEFIANQAQLEVEHKKLLRSQELLALGAASREEFEGIEATHQTHTAHVEEARQKLLLLGLNAAQIEQVRAGQQVSSDIAIPAPIDGVITVRNINPGQVVTTAQEIFTVTDLSSVWIEGGLLEDDFASVRIGSRVTITTPAYPGRTYRGTVDYIDPRVDPQTRTAKVRVIADNTDLALRLGMYMDMLFTQSGAKASIVPPQAIQMIGASRVVYSPVDGEPGRFLQRSVEGVHPGERVVTQGSFLLRAEALRQHPQ